MTFWQRAAAYADSVLSGDIPACVYVRQACRRFLKDLDRDDLEISEDGERWCRFLEKLPHVKGRWAGRRERFQLSDWQIFCTVNLYGWKWKATGRRRFQEAYIEVPRKNGKSFWFGGLGVGHLVLDGEYGAEVYCGATSEKQAWEVFRPAKMICERTPKLRERFGVDVNAKSLVRLEDGSRFEPVIGKPGDGASPSCAIADEFHEHATSDQVDTFTTGMGAREQPMMLYITTAGSDMGGPCYEKRADVIRILNGTYEDDRVFAIIYTIDEKDRWDSVEALRKANPNLGISVREDYLLGEMEQAKRSARKQNTFRTKHLNQWVGSKTAWMNMLKFQRCRRKKLTLSDLHGERCYLGIDLASKIDIASVAMLFPPSATRDRYHAFVRHYLPEDRIQEASNDKYGGWHRDGWMVATPGDVTDFGYIEEDLEQLKSQVQIVEAAFDPFQATQFSTRMVEKGFPMVEVGATVKNLSEPMKELEALVRKQQILFDQDPVLMWMFGNVVARLDRKDNIFPNKERPEAKIDGVVALIMALNRALLDTPPRRSIYEEGEIA
ncbi:MAG TPA: terminase TerL endonuclease subunit [Acidimicrobiia bacterium]